MVDIRLWWSEITNSEIDSLIAYSPYEWLVLRRLVNNTGGGKEISEDDLTQSIPSDKIDRFRAAIASLKKKKVIRSKPKTNIVICQVHVGEYTAIVKKFTALIRKNKDLYNSLLAEEVTFIKTSDKIFKLIDSAYKNKDDISYSTRTSNNLSIFGELGIVIAVTFVCPHTKNSKKFDFEILDPRDIHKKTQTWLCDCGRDHTCCANGRMF